MHSLVYIVTVIFLTISGVCLAYLMVLALFGIKISGVPLSNGKNRFAILIPAHNEEGVIDALLDSIERSNYPKELYKCYVVADHCTDGTVAKVKSHNVMYFEKNDGYPGKGRALSWIIDIILKNDEDKYDAFLFFDADNEISPDFLRIMSDSIDKGHRIIQGYVDVIDWKKSVFSIVNYINYVTINRLKENARSSLGLSCRLRGHGMCFVINEVKSIEWKTDSRVEDKDIFFQVILQGKRVVWAHRAKVYSFLPSNIRDSKKQRIRWSMAKHNYKNRYIKDIFIRFLQYPRVNTLDALVEAFIPSNALLIGLTMAALLLSFLYANGFWMTTWAFVTLFTYFLYFMLGAMLEGIPVRFIVYFIFSPVFIFWRIWIFLLSFRKAEAGQWR